MQVVQSKVRPHTLRMALGAICVSPLSTTSDGEITAASLLEGDGASHSGLAKPIEGGACRLCLVSAASRGGPLNAGGFESLLGLSLGDCFGSCEESDKSCENRGSLHLGNRK